MNVSERGVRFVAGFEGFVARPTPDPVGFCTVGYGHLIREGPCTTADRTKWGTLTVESAAELLRKDLSDAETDVNRLVRVPLTQSQFDALVSFVFNLGTGAFETSTLLRKLNARDYHGAAEEFLRWNHAGGRVLPGLTRRRQAERAMFLAGEVITVDHSDFQTPVRDFQIWSNAYYRAKKLPFGPIHVDGIVGSATLRRVHDTKFYMGYATKFQDPEITNLLLRQLQHPLWRTLFNPFQWARGLARRRYARQHGGDPGSGTVVIDGFPVAHWITPEISWIREQGWTGSVISGHRTCKLQEQLYEIYKRCGFCPEHIAASDCSSEHNGIDYPKGAVDVTQRDTFARLAARYHETFPRRPYLKPFGSHDPPHFSGTGR